MPASPTAILLGGTGFIGSALRAEIAGVYSRVVVLSRFKDRAPLEFGEHTVVGDLSDVECLDRLPLEGADVFHMAGSSNPSTGNWEAQDDLLSNVIPTIALLKACVVRQARRVIYVSSGGAIYGAPEHLPLTEDSPTNPISAYGIGKLAVEKYLSLYERHSGLKYVSLRVSNPYGPGQRPDRPQGVVASTMFRMILGLPVVIWGDGQSARDFVHVADVARAIRLAADYEGGKTVFNIGSGQPRSVASIVDDVQDVLALDQVTRDFMPSRSFDVPVNYLDISRARRSLGWSPQKTWNDGLYEAAVWMRDGVAEGRFSLPD